MSIRRIPKRKTSTGTALGLCLLLLASISACGASSTEVVFVPSEVLAQFAVFQSTTDTPSSSATTFHAGAIFYKGLITMTVNDGLVEVVDPGGTAHAMRVEYNQAGAPYYVTALPSFQLAGNYVFRVTLADGTQLSASITAPSQALAITNPAVGATRALNDYLQVDWTGTGARNVAIVLRRPTTLELFSIVGLAPVQAPDTGSFDGAPPHLPLVFFSSARELGDAGTGTRYLTITRNNSISVGGFFAGSFAQASLVHAIQMDIQP